MNNMEQLILVQSCPVNQAQSPYLEIEDKAEKILQLQNTLIFFLGDFVAMITSFETLTPAVNDFFIADKECLSLSSFTSLD